MGGPSCNLPRTQRLWPYFRMSGWGMESGVPGPRLAAQGTFLLRAQETCAVRAEPLLLVRINASGGLILRMGAINRCLKHPLARDTPVCLLAVLGEQHSGKAFLLNHLLRSLPGLVRAGLGQGVRGGDWGRGRVWGVCSQPGFGREMGAPPAWTNGCALFCLAGVRGGWLAKRRGVPAGIQVGCQ